MASKLYSILISLFPIIGNCILIGNPAQPCLQTQGLHWEDQKWVSFRAGYLQDYVYKQRFHEEFQIDECTTSSSRIKLWTQASILTINIKDRLDIYGVVGGQKLEIGSDVIAKQSFAWGVGGKLVFFHEGKFRAGFDVKYLESNPAPRFFECDKFAYNVKSHFHFNYSQLQAALGLAYKTKNFSPYANASYLVSKLRALPPSVTVRVPMMDMEVDVNAKSIIGRNRFGMALGTTITDRKRASLTVEWRGFNQNAINASGDIRF